MMTTGASTRQTLRSTAADREKTATRLLNSSARNSYDPLLDIDWAAEPPPGVSYLPLECVSLYGTELWEQMSTQQRLDLSRHELASFASTGLWFEIMLLQMMARYVFDQDPQAAHTQYALTEIGDETRHIIMFAKSIATLDCPTYRPRPLVDALARLYKATCAGVNLFAPVLVAEEVTDRLQRSMMLDETVDPTVRMVNRIHIIEEARHVRFAREEVARLRTRSGPVRGFLDATSSAIVSAIIVSSLINPAVYEAVGLDRTEAIRQARHNPHFHQTRRMLGEKVMAFLDEQGLITWSSRPIYKWVHLI
jgi:P-aminobenzoate N-oxygenase AurF